MKFSVDMKMEEQDLVAFIRLSKVVSKFKYGSTKIVFIVIAVMALAFGLFEFYFKEENGVLIFMVVIAALCAAFVLIYDKYLLYRLKYNQRGRENYHFEFNRTNFVVTDYMGPLEYDYQRVLMIYETEDNFFLAFGVDNMLNVAKRGLSGGTPKEFRQFVEDRANCKTVKVNVKKSR